MTAISATTMGIAPANTLQAVLAQGAVLGGTQPDAQLAPVIPGVNAGLDGVATSAPTTQPAAAVTGGGAQAVQGAGAIGENPQLIAALQAVANAIQQLAGLLQAQAGAAMPSASAVTGGGDTIGQCGMAGCTMDHGSAAADPALATTESPQLQAATIDPVADANVGTAPIDPASGAPAPTSVAPPSTA